MITNKQELRRYLEMDQYALNRGYCSILFSTDLIWKFQIVLRKSMSGQ